MKAAIYRHHSITLIALATLLSYPLLSTAADKAGLSVTIVSAEERTCGRFVSAREDAMRGNHVRANSYIDWLGGYITAFNHFKPDTYNILGNSDKESVMQWLENYCKQNLLETFSEATDALMVELYPKRIRQKPKGG